LPSRPAGPAAFETRSETVAFEFGETAPETTRALYAKVE
jgi:hypothetical protein